MGTWKRRVLEEFFSSDVCASCSDASLSGRDDDDDASTFPHVAAAPAFLCECGLDVSVQAWGNTFRTLMDLAEMVCQLTPGDGNTPAESESDSGRDPSLFSPAASQLSQ